MALASARPRPFPGSERLESDRQMRRLGECLIDLYRTDGKEVTIEPNK